MPPCQPAATHRNPLDRRHFAVIFQRRNTVTRNGGEDHATDAQRRGDRDRGQWVQGHGGVHAAEEPERAARRGADRIGAGGDDGRESGQRVEAPGAAAPAPYRGPAQGGAQRALPHLGPDDVRPVRSGVREPGAGAGGEPGGAGERLSEGRWRAEVWMNVASNAWNRLRYTLIAPLYDAVVRVASQRRRSISLLELRPGERLLISGSGTGADLPYVPPDVEVHAVDITPAMVERTRRRAAALGREVEARVGDAQALDY